MSDNYKNPTADGQLSFASSESGGVHTPHVRVVASNTGGAVNRPTVTVTATPDYSIGDVIGGIIALTSLMSAAGRSAILKSLVLKDSAGQGPALTLLFFRSTPTGGTYTDNAAFAWGATDQANLVGVVSVAAADWKTIASKSQVALGGIDQAMASATDALYLIIIADSTYNAATTSDLSLEAGFEQR